MGVEGGGQAAVVGGEFELFEDDLVAVGLKGLWGVGSLGQDEGCIVWVTLLDVRATA